MYEQNSQMYLEALFSSSSFSDFLNKSEYFEQIAAYDQKNACPVQGNKKAGRGKQKHVWRRKRKSWMK